MKPIETVFQILISWVMNKIVISIFCGLMLSAIAFSATQAQDEVVVADRGYECFNLEIAQAQLAQARSDRNWRAVRQARLSVKNWEKLCK
jgi:hypothetical protein